MTQTTASTRPGPSDEPNWDDYPILDGVGTSADTQTKGQGNFAATYANWAKVLRILREHAKGWQAQHRSWVDADGREHCAFQAPDGTASVCVYFRAPKGSGFLDTPDYIQPVLKANKPVPWEKCDALTVTNTIKRGWAAAASAHFGLFSELWSKDPLEDPYQNEDLTPPAQPTPAPKRNQPAQSDPLAADRDTLRQMLFAEYQQEPQILADFQAGLKKAFPADKPLGISADKPTLENCTHPEHIEWVKTFITGYETK